MKNKKRVFIIVGIIILIISFVLVINFITNKFFPTGKSVKSQQVEIIPLSSEERQKVLQAILSSEFIQDIPEDAPISLRFFNFENNQRIWQDGFLIGQNQLLSKGNPAISLIMHSKYISELNQENLCEIIEKANKNNDLGFYSEYSKPKLFLKYSSMLKHKECFGF